MRNRINIEIILQKAKIFAQMINNIQLEFSQNTGVDAVIKAISNFSTAVGIGPPGAGKSLVPSYALARKFPDFDRDEVALVTTPPNRLLSELATRTIGALLAQGIDEDTLRRSVRIYGSEFVPLRLDKDVKLVFSTPYQPGALKRLLDIKKRVHIILDEASTTPLHEPFKSPAMAISQALDRGETEWLASLSVVGDPMQAIDPQYTGRDKLDLLIIGRILTRFVPPDELESLKDDFPRIFEVANHYLSQLDIEYFFLDITHRLPKPTEDLVSIPFYNGLLKGKYSYKDRLKEIIRDKPNKKLIEISNIHSEITNLFESAISSQIPVVYLRDTGKAYASGIRRRRELDELDTVRADYACKVALYLSAWVRRSALIEVLTPYREMKSYITFCLREHQQQLPIRVSTIHESLGSEADIEIAVMGKEYRGKKTRTIYFNMPELLDVQFSRHRAMLIIIGNVERLVDNFEKIEGLRYVARINDALDELKSRELIISQKIRK